MSTPDLLPSRSIFELSIKIQTHCEAIHSSASKNFLMVSYCDVFPILGHPTESLAP